MTGEKDGRATFRECYSRVRGDGAGRLKSVVAAWVMLKMTGVDGVSLAERDRWRVEDAKR